MDLLLFKLTFLLVLLVVFLVLGLLILVLWVRKDIAALVVPSRGSLILLVVTLVLTLRVRS